MRTHVGTTSINVTSQITRLLEKPTPEKLSLLYEKNLYTLALSVAQTQGLDTTDVHRHHGDHLYQRGDYDGAMREYIQTIGGVRASYVIRKVSSCVSAVLVG